MLCQGHIVSEILNYNLKKCFYHYCKHTAYRLLAIGPIIFLLFAIDN